MSAWKRQHYLPLERMIYRRRPEYGLRLEERLDLDNKIEQMVKAQNFYWKMKVKTKRRLLSESKQPTDNLLLFVY